MAFVYPYADYGDGLGGQWSGALFAAFAVLCRAGCGVLPEAASQSAG